MSAKNGEIFDFDNSTHPFFIPVIDVWENGYLYEGLWNQLWTFFDYLQSQVLSVFVVEYLQHLTEGPLVDWTHNLVSVSHMISNIVAVKITKLDGWVLFGQRLLISFKIMLPFR